MIPGEMKIQSGDIVTCRGRKTISIKVSNTGDRPVQVGSHYHFAEANPGLQFDREKAVGFKLDVPAGSSVRFEPGQERTVTLIQYGGNRAAYGFRGETMGRT